MHTPTLKRALPALLIFVSGLFGGIILKTVFLLYNNQHSTENAEVRLEQYKYINPLLECEPIISQEVLEYKPLRADIVKKIDAAIASHTADRVSLYFRSMKNGRWIGVNENEKFPAASLMKLPFLISYLKLAENKPDIFTKTIRFDGGVDLSQTQQIRPSHSIEAGQSYTIEELLRRMIVYSGNNSTNLLVKNIDPSIIDEVLSDLNIPIERNAQHDALISAKAFSFFFRILYNASYLTREMSERALHLLVDAEFREGLEAGVPKTVPVGDKFGEYRLVNEKNVQTGAGLHDCGIIYHPKNPYFLCIMTEGRELGTLEALIADLSHLIYNSVDADLK